MTSGSIAGTALLSAPFSKVLVEPAQRLASLGWRLVVTENLRSELDAISNDVVSIADYVGVSEPFAFPPTLHPRVEAALTMDELPSDERIDLLYEVPYPLEEGNDVGGHTLMALACKGQRIVATTPAQLATVAAALAEDSDHRTIADDLRRRLLGAAARGVAMHYLEVARRVGDADSDGLIAHHHWRLANGENPYQQPASLLSCDTDDPLAISAFERLGGADPCFTNLADMDAILHGLGLAHAACSRLMTSPFFVVVTAKHGNPCGLAVSQTSPRDCVERALFGHPAAVWGGECATNFPITAELAELLFRHDERKASLGNAHWMLDLICAPSFDEAARVRLGKRASRHLMENPALSLPTPQGGQHYRQVRGGLLRQPVPSYVLDFTGADIVGELDEARRVDVAIAWAAAFASFHGGNEVALAKDGQLIGVGGGPSTIDAARTAVARARENGHDTAGASFAADAFFPFTDAPEVLIEAGCVAGTVPSGGKRHADVRERFSEDGLAIAYLPESVRGFYRH